MAAFDELEEYRKALELIEVICTEEINTRFPPRMRSKSEEESARGSKVYSLLAVPRNIARAALSRARSSKDEGTKDE